MTSTDRLYQAAQEAFQIWCRAKRIRFPPKQHNLIAEYLKLVEQERGASAVPVHLSAIARVYRDAELPLDAKSPIIQDVVKVARSHMRPKHRKESSLTISEDVLDAAMLAYNGGRGLKKDRADRNRLRLALQEAVSRAFSEGYRQGFAAAEYNDSGSDR